MQKICIRTCAMAVLAFAATAGAQVFSVTTPVTIPDVPTAVSQIEVSGVGSISDLNVLVNIDHTWDADLDMVLVGPDAADYLHLSSDNGGSGDNYRFTRFDDECPTLISAGSGAGAAPPFNNNFRPEGGVIAWSGSVPLPAAPLNALRDFDGRSGGGTWTLLVDDDSAGSTGTLRGWSLEFNGALDPQGPPLFTGPLPPVGTGFADPDRALPLQSVRLAVRVVPGINPPSTLITVRADASSIGGPAITILEDPDQDLVYDAIIPVAAGTTPEVKTISFSIQDAQTRSGSGSFTLLVLPPPPVNDVCAQAMEIPSGGPFPLVTNPVSILSAAVASDLPMCVPQAARDVWFRYVSPGDDNLLVSTCPAQAPGITVPDTVVSVYESPDGTCSNLIPLVCADDVCALRESFFLGVQQGRTYFIQVARVGASLPSPGADLISLSLDPTLPATNPSATGIAIPPLAVGGTLVTFDVAVVPGTQPDSTGITVVLDATSIGGPQQLPLISVNGGLTFSGSQVVQGAPGPRQLPFVVQDEQTRFTTGVIDLRIVPAASSNDLCSAALIIPGDGPFPVVTLPEEVQGNAPAPESPMCSPGGGRTAWYSFTPVRAFQYEFVTCRLDCPEGTLDDTILSLYRSTSGCAELQQIACTSAGVGCGPRAALVSPVLEAGQTYFLQAGTSTSQIPPGGSSVLQLAVRELPPVGACCLQDGCRLLLEEECAAAGGSFLGQGVICGSDAGYATESGPPFASIVGQSVPVQLGDDEAVNVPLGFPFTLYGTIYHDVYVSANGLLSFGRASDVFLNSAIPSTDLPNACIYALWDDLNPESAGTQGGVSYQRIISDGQSRFTAQWTRVPQFLQSDENTFQIVLNQDGSIELRYGEITPQAATGDYTIGIEDGTGSRAMSINGAALGSGQVAFRFEPLDSFGCCRWRADGCFADFDDSGGIDADDVIGFFGAWDMTDACADLNDSGGVDSDDVIDFFGAWDAGGIGYPGC